MNKINTQHNRLNAYFTKNVFARSYELVVEGIDRKTIQRAVESGNPRKIGYGLYQAIDASLDFNMSFAVGLRFLIWYNLLKDNEPKVLVAVGLRLLIWYNSWNNQSSDHKLRLAYVF